jgi:predicted enzyme related to lactoylglutathione lyase
MGDMGELRANNTWKVYLATDDIAQTVKTAEAEGAQVVSPVMAVADLGSQAVLIDPTGANIGVWQPGTFPGFTVLNEPGAPSWFELLTRDYKTALDFYRSAFAWETAVVSDTDEFRYAVMRNPAGSGELAGVMDASGFLTEGTPSSWIVYWEVDDIDAVAAKIETLHGSVTTPPQNTPYGRLATVRDPSGAEFKLRATR